MRSVEISSQATEQLDAEVLTPATDGDKRSARPCKYRIMLCFAVTATGVLILAVSAVLLIFIVLCLKSDIAALQKE